MSVYVIAVFLCRMDDGSGRDYASDDEHLPLSTVLYLSMPFWELLSILLILYSN